MTWAKLDDRLHGHPKVRRAGLEAMGLWVLGLSFCAAYLTDGRIARADVEGIAGRRAVPLAARLVEAGLWEVTPEGWVYRDYLTYNPSAAEVAAERSRKQEAGRRGGFAKAASASKTLAGASPLLPEPALLPIPSRPVPSPEIQSTRAPRREPEGQADLLEVQRPEEAAPGKGGKRGGPRAEPTAEQRYRAAFVAGIHDAAPDVPFSLGGSLGMPFALALREHAKGLAGAELDAWIRAWVAEWRLHADPRFASGWAPSAFVKWLNGGKPAAGAPGPGRTVGQPLDGWRP